jgi:uncharacterized protein YceK
MKVAYRAAVVLLLSLTTAGCAGVAPRASTQPSASSTTQPALASYDEYHDAACQAWDALDRAVGNPETGSGSELSRALDEAAATGDGPGADGLAADIKAELATGRRHLAVARTWAPRAETMAQFDRVFSAFEAMTDAKRAMANAEPDAVDPQLAFERAGGLEAWYAMFESMSEEDMTSGKPCPNVPVTP